MTASLISALENIPDLKISENEPMARHTTMRVGGPARLFLDAKSCDAAVSVKKTLAEFGIAPFTVGNGSNLLVSDEGFDGIILKLSCSKITVSENTIFAEAGAALSSLASVAQRAGLTGLEFAHGIPGSVGGAVFMNAGAYGGEISNILTESSYVTNDGSVGRFDAFEHEFSYRTSIYEKRPELTVLSACFALSPGNPNEIRETMQDFAARRRDKQPLEFPSAGSVFKRPEGHFAGALIENCGLKGTRIGDAEVSEKHAGFIINRGNATCADVCALIEHIREVVLKETGISLECEVLKI